MIAVVLSPEDWNKVLAVLATGPWNAVNPLLMAIGEQLRQAQTAGADYPKGDGVDKAAKGMTQ